MSNNEPLKLRPANALLAAPVDVMDSVPDRTTLVDVLLKRGHDKLSLLLFEAQFSAPEAAKAPFVPPHLAIQPGDAHGGHTAVGVVNNGGGVVGKITVVPVFVAVSRVWVALCQIFVVVLVLILHSFGILLRCCGCHFFSIISLRNAWV
jgi:hypothetical protein